MPRQKINIIGNKFHRLTVLSEVNPIKYKSNNGRKVTISMYLCQCECGNQKIINGFKLRNGKTKSCGCLIKEIAQSKIPNMIQKSTKYDPYTALAVKVWKKHYDDDGLSFDDFINLTQQNCHYCGQTTSNNLIKNNILFSYNGLDRIDSNLGHTKDNCVPCCIICNRGKSNQPYQQALQWMDRLVNNFNINKVIEYNYFSLPDNNYIKYIRTIYRGIKFKGTNIDLSTFYSLSQLNCYYCNGDKSNKYKLFIYNGLDRVDSEIKYLHGNIVPCCKYCNFAKKNLTLNQFKNWVDKLKIFRLTHI